MNGPEIHPAVDAANVQAQRNAEAFSEATQRAVAEATVLAELVKIRRCKRATLALLIRVAVAVSLSFCLVMCTKYELMAGDVCIFFIVALASWLCIWVGAWMQFMWGKEGLLK